MLRWRQLRAVLLLPGIVTVVIPALILRRTNNRRAGWGLPRPWNALPVASGLLLIGAGLALLAQTVRLFATRGQGTLAPWEPPRHLVVDGIYRRVRNPMISGALSILLGESIVFGSRQLLFWFVAAFGLNLVYIPLFEERGWSRRAVRGTAAYIPLFEERGLARRFGSEYHAYRQHVPRWIPLVQPWTPPWEEARASGSPSAHEKHT